jgi:hypothetical protein
VLMAKTRMVEFVDVVLLSRCVGARIASAPTRLSALLRRSAAEAARGRRRRQQLHDPQQIDLLIQNQNSALVPTQIARKKKVY